MKAALSMVTNWTRAVDIGAHVGLWAMNLVEVFDHVEAFEPVKLHRECFEKNVKGANLYPYALAEKEKKVAIRIAKGSSGDSHVDPDAEGNIEAKTLDSYGFEDVGFVKIDCEGFEYFVLQGAKETLLRYKPVLIIEQKPNKGRQFGLSDTEGVRYLESLGAKLVGEMAGDYILKW